MSSSPDESGATRPDEVSPVSAWSDLRRIITIVFTGIHGVLWLTLLVPLFWIVPRFKEIFKAFKMDLPAPTELLLNVSNWLHAYWYLLPPFFLIMLALDGWIIFMLFPNPRSQRRGLRIAASCLWFVLVIGVTLALFEGSILGIYLPMFKLIEGLSNGK